MVTFIRTSRTLLELNLVNVGVHNSSIKKKKKRNLEFEKRTWFQRIRTSEERNALLVDYQSRYERFVT